MGLSPRRSIHRQARRYLERLPTYRNEMVYGLVVVAVVVYIAAGGRLGLARLRLLRLRADCDFVLRYRGLSCSLRSLSRCCCLRRLGLPR